MNKLTILFVFVAFLSGCAAKGPVFEEVSATHVNKATVYIYRPSLMFNSAGWPEIFVDGDELFELRNNGYAVLFLDAGTHDIKAEGSKFLTNWYPEPVTYSANFNAGEEYFLRVTPKLDSAMFIGTVATMSGSATITPVSKQQALTELTDTKLVYRTDL